MVIKVDKGGILKGLSLVSGVITTKNTLPILSNILIQTKGGALELTATDLDVGISTNISVEVVEDGAITIPAKKFLEIIRELPESTITITTKKNNIVNIECENTFFKIIGIPKEEFPKIPKITKENKITMPQSVLKGMLTTTLFAVSQDKTRYVLNGILFEIKENKIKLVATDGRRLAIATRNTELPKNTNTKVVVPTKALQELNGIITNEGDLCVLFEENQAMFVLGDTVIISRLIEGEFPSYEQAIPKETKDVVMIDRDKFLLATKRAALLVTPDSQAIKLDITKNKMVVLKQTPNIGEAREELECKYGGDGFFIGFNPGYILDGFKHIRQEQINIGFSGPEKPAVVKDGDEYLYVVLPMQIA